MNDDAPEQAPLVLVAADQEIADAIGPAFAAQGLRVRATDSLPSPDPTGVRGPCALVLDGRDRDIATFVAEGIQSGRIGPQMIVLAVVEETPDPELYREWLRAGIWDVARVPLDAELLALRIGNVLKACASGYPRRSHPPAFLDPYSWPSLVRVADETLALASRYHRPLACVAIGLDWQNGASGDSAQEIAGRLAAAAQQRVRGSDIVGVSHGGILLVLLPDTDRPRAAVFTGRMLQFLESRLKEWEVLGRLQSGLSLASENGSRSAAEFLLAAARSVA